jgi:sugar/nucleoside kinase (ribokinase family)
MSVDVACGELAFMDLTFEGLDGLPGAGEERHARDFHRSPGGAAIVAIGAARLGLSSAVCSPIGADADGKLLRHALAAERVRWAGREVARTAVTAVLPSHGERAMATFDPGEQVTADELAAVAPHAVVLSLPRIALAPSGAALYATVGDAEARAEAADPTAPLERARALIVNEREACVMTRIADAEGAARRLAERTQTVVVTLGARGALALADGQLVRAPGVDAQVVDTTGAGDLFTAAYVWADRLGATLEDRLRWAVLYAAMSVRVATAVAGAASRAALEAAGARLGLAPPAGPQSVGMKEGSR